MEEILRDRLKRMLKNKEVKGSELLHELWYLAQDNVLCPNAQAHQREEICAKLGMAEEIAKLTERPTPKSPASQ